MHQAAEAGEAAPKRPRTPHSTAGSSRWRRTAPSSECGGPSSRSPAPTSRSVVPGVDRHRIADLHVPVLDALRRRDPDGAGRPSMITSTPPPRCLPACGTVTIPAGWRPEAGAIAHATRPAPGGRRGSPGSRTGRTPSLIRRTRRPRKDEMNDQLQLSEEMSAGTARLRVDVYGSEPREHVLDDLTFLNYRLADVRISPEVTLAEPDIIWQQDGDKAIRYDGRVMRFTGPWPAGPSRRSSSRCSRFGWRRWGCIPPTARPSIIAAGPCSSWAASPTTARAWATSKRAFAARSRSRPRPRSSTRVATPSPAPRTPSSGSAPRAPSGPTRPPPNKGVEKFWGEMPTWGMYRGTPNIDLVIVPAIDGNFDPATNELIPFERQFQFLHSLQNYFLTQRAAGSRPRDADGGQRRPRARSGRLSSSASLSAPSTSFGRPPRRSSWTRSTRSSEPGEG